MLTSRRSPFLLAMLALFAALSAPLCAQVAIDGNANPRIMPLGDSITAGWGSSIGGYRAELGSRLQMAGYTYTYVGSQGTFNPNGSSGLNHEGHSGWTTPQITAIVNGSFSSNSTSADHIITTANPDVVLLMIGTNDMIGAAGPNLNADYATLITAIFAQKPTVRVIVLPMIYSQNFAPVQSDNITYGGRNIQYIGGQNIVTDRTRPSLVTTVTDFQQAGKRITFFDGMNTVVTPTNVGNTAVLYDGIHPTAATYQGMGTAVVRAIQDVTPGAAGSVVPTPPSGLIASASGNGFDLTWTTNSLNETGFQVEATTDPAFLTGIVSTTAAAGANHVVFGGLQANTAYYLRVRASNGAGASPASFPVRATTGSGVSSQVSTPTFSPAGGTYSNTQSVTLSCPTSGATIHFTTDGTTPTAASASYVSAISVAATTTIKALATKSGSTDSAVASATYTIQAGGGGVTAPTGFAATAVASTQINLTWTIQGSGATAIRVERDTDAGFSNPVSVDLAATADCLQVARLQPTTTYYFRLRAVQGGTTSSPIIANATTQALVQLVMIGDSITAGWSFARPNTSNKGIAGDQSNPALDRFFTDVNINRPRLVTIMIGTNDIANSVPVATIQANIAAMAQMAVNAGIGVILGTIPPAGNTTVRPTATINAVNAWIANYVQQNNLTLADYHAAMWPYNDANYGDALHPNGTGYALMAPVLDAAVQAALNKLSAGSYGAAPPDMAPASTGTKLTGATIGGGGNPGLALDGDINTLYESAPGNNGSGGYAGIDLGVGNAQRIGAVRCYPRSDVLFTRAFGGRFQGSNTSATAGFVDLAAITLVPVQGRWQAIGVTSPTAFRWLRYYSPTGGLCSIAEIEFQSAGSLPPAVTLDQVRSQFGKRTGDPGWEDAADLNHDGRVDAQDVRQIVQGL